MESLNFKIELNEHYGIIRKLDGDIIRHTTEFEEQLWIRLEQLQEENNRLKGLLKYCHEHGEKYGVFETMKKYAPDLNINPNFLTFEQWLDKQNIKL
jgi:hypothetical protein